MFLCLYPNPELIPTQSAMHIYIGYMYTYKGECKEGEERIGELRGVSCGVILGEMPEDAVPSPSSTSSRATWNIIPFENKQRVSSTHYTRRLPVIHSPPTPLPPPVQRTYISIYLRGTFSELQATRR